MPVEMTDTELETIFGSTDPKVILQRKSTDKQYKNFSKKASIVSLTADECKALCKSVGLEYLEGYEKRVLEHTITDETVDRDGDIIRASGVDLKNYKKNPVILFGHNYHDFPIGKTVKIWNDKEDKSIKAWGLFFDDRVDTTGRSDVAFKFISNGGMPAVSIGFGPIEVNWPQSKDEREELGLGAYGVEYKKTELWEYSACPVPSNPNALRKMVKDGVLDKNNCKTIINNKLISDDGINDFGSVVKNVFGDDALDVEDDLQLKEKAPDGFDNIVDFYDKTEKSEESDKDSSDFTIKRTMEIDGENVVYCLCDCEWTKDADESVTKEMVNQIKILNENIKHLQEILLPLLDIKSPDTADVPSGDENVDDDDSLYDVFGNVEL